MRTREILGFAVLVAVLLLVGFATGWAAREIENPQRDTDEVNLPLADPAPVFHSQPFRF